MHVDSGLYVWFDRTTDNINFGLTPGTVPMVVTSRSLYNDGGSFLFQKCTKRDIKIDAVEHAISILKIEISGTVELDDVRKAQLYSLLTKFDDDDF